MPQPPARYPRPPANIAPYVEALGTRLAMHLLLELGGAELPVSARARPRGSRLVEVIGLDGARALAARRDDLQPRVPLGNRWLAACLHAEGRSVAEIARILRASDVAVRWWLSGKSLKAGCFDDDAD